MAARLTSFIRPHAEKIWASPHLASYICTPGMSIYFSANMAASSSSNDTFQEASKGWVIGGLLGAGATYFGTRFPALTIFLVLAPAGSLMISNAEFLRRGERMRLPPSMNSIFPIFFKPDPRPTRQG